MQTTRGLLRLARVAHGMGTLRKSEGTLPWTQRLSHPSAELATRQGAESCGHELPQLTHVFGAGIPFSYLDFIQPWEPSQAPPCAYCRCVMI